MGMEIAYNILIGPLPSPSFLGKYAHSPRIKTFGSWPYAQTIQQSEPFPQSSFDITYTLQETLDFDAILNALPQDWIPDIVFWICAGYQALPPGIESCPYPVALLAHDWYSVNFFSPWDHRDAFDYIFCDQHLLQLLQTNGYTRAAYWPCYGFDPGRHFVMPEVARIYDIGFAGNLAPNYYQRRNQTIKRIGKMRSQFKICISQGGYKAYAYTRFLNQCKIIVNPTMHGEMNLRAYEAPACGALLFIEADNLEIQQFLADRESCVLYDDSNLEALLAHYLSHPQEREKIAKNGWLQIQNFCYEKQFEMLLKQIPLVLISPSQRFKRKFRQKPAFEKELLRARQLYFSRTPGALETALSRLKKALKTELNPQHKLCLAHALGVMLINQTFDYHKMDAALNRGQPAPPDISPQDQQAFQTGLQWLEAVVAQTPTHPLYFYNLGWAYGYLQKYPQALSYFNQALSLFETHPFDPNDLNYRFLLPMGLSQRHLTQFYTEWQKAFIACYQFPGVANSDRIQKLIQSQILMVLGHDLTRQGQHHHANQAYTQASQLFPESVELKEIHAKSCLLIGEKNTAAQIFTALTETYPFIYTYWYHLILLYYQTQSYQKALHCITQLEALFEIQDTPTDLFELRRAQDFCRSLRLEIKHIVTPLSVHEDISS